MKKLTVKQHILVCTIISLIGAGLILLGGILSEFLKPHIIFWLGIIVFISAIIYRLIFVRCPHCGDLWLSMRTMPEYCPKCGRSIF